MRSALRKARELKGLTQAEVAKAVGIDRVSYLHIEVGRRNPSTRVALRIADVLEDDPRVLFADLLSDDQAATLDPAVNEA